MSDDCDLTTRAKGIQLNEKTDINILLLGETGVGKSTFINSIANYLTFSHLKKAEKENLLVLIPSKCRVRDKNGVDHTVEIGSAKDQNEYLDTGVSATQDVKTYVFPIWNGQTKVRLIDTPGMGDTRGIQQDDINCENILTYIGQLHKLHAICFLFKPTNTRITKFFGYCMSQIFSRLDKSASKNIIFVFTNTRGTDYGPGDTFSILQEVVKDIESAKPDVRIPLNRNVFCFDNEAFRYLAAIKKEIEFDNSVKLKNNESWEKSVDQCWRLITYIVGDAKNPPLKPHFIKSTSAINEARRMIIRLSQPLAEISQLINDNLLTLQRHREILSNDSNSIDELKKKLYMPVISLKVINMTQPVTVCTGSQCAEVYKVGDNNKWHYKQRCHDPCFLTYVPKEIIGSPELVHCAAMNHSTGFCQKCGCMFSIHMHIYYMTETVEDRIVDESVQQNIFDKEKVIQRKRTLIDEISQRKTEMEREHQIIVRCSARFAHFLQTNAITAFSDSYKEYIQYLIIRERSLGVLSNMATVHHLEKLLREYEEAKKSFDEALELQKKLGESDIYITPQKIQDSIQELYKLKHNGKKIKELYECQKTSRSKEHEYTEYVHKVISKPVKSDATKADKKKDKKDSDAQKNQTQQKQGHKGDAKENSQSRNARSESQQRRQRDRPRTPPPPYNKLQPHYPPPGPYPPPPPPPGAYAPPPNGPHSYHYAPGYDTRGHSGQVGSAGSYEFQIRVEPNQGQNVSSTQHPPSHPSPYPGYYNHTHPYPAPPGGHPPPPGSYNPPPPGAYNPPPAGTYPPPPGGYPYHYNPYYDYYNQGPSSHSYQSTDNHTARQGNTGYGQGGKGRSRRGRGGTNKNQQFKKGFHKKRNERQNDKKSDSDDDSDSSVASSKN